MRLRTTPRRALFWTSLGAFIGVTSVGCLFEELASGGDTAFDCGPSFNDGNRAVTGVDAADAFLSTSQALMDKGDLLGATLEMELAALTQELGIDMEAPAGDDAGTINGQNSLGVRVRELFQEQIGVELVLRAKRAACQGQPREAFASAMRCQNDVGCGVATTAAEENFECLGRCETSPRNQLSCGESADAHCTFSGSNLACTGTCVGTCTFSADAVQDCPGECWGICQGSCSQFGDADLNGTRELGECIGACRGSCEGTCRAHSLVGVDCDGTCSGECSLEGSTLDCANAAVASCEEDGSAAAGCSGGCDGDFAFPDSLLACEASYGCASWAKVDMLLRAECVSAVVEAKALPNKLLDAGTQQRVQFMVAALERRVPTILTLVEQATVLAQAGADLATSAGGAEEGMLALLEGRDDISTETRRRLLECAPQAFEDAGNALVGHLNVLNGRVAKALGLQSGLIGFQ
ncbi:MAG: hypothetical protein QM778_10675 [Myxococcales bacterium]